MQQFNYDGAAAFYRPIHSAVRVRSHLTQHAPKEKMWKSIIKETEVTDLKQSLALSPQL